MSSLLPHSTVMADRKTINKYYPPDFDPSAITKRNKSKKESAAAQLQTVRLMAPFSMRCTHCGEFIYRGKKFNARKQQTGELYLGIKIVRFYIKCPRCAGEIRFKTDPKIADYVTEFGAERNHEPWREKHLEEETLEQRLERLEKEAQEKLELEEHKKLYGSEAKLNAGEDPMAELEARVESTKRQVAVQDELDQLRMRNARIERATSASLIGKDEKPTEDHQETADDLAAKNAFKRSSDGTIIRTISSDEPASIVKPTGIFQAKKIKPFGVSSSKVTKKSNLGIIIKKKASLI